MSDTFSLSRVTCVLLSVLLMWPLSFVNANEGGGGDGSGVDILPALQANNDSLPPPPPPSGSDYDVRLEDPTLDVPGDAEFFLVVGLGRTVSASNGDEIPVLAGRAITIPVENPLEDSRNLYQSLRSMDALNGEPIFIGLGELRDGALHSVTLIAIEVGTLAAPIWKRFTF